MSDKACHHPAMPRWKCTPEIRAKCGRYAIPSGCFFEREVDDKDVRISALEAENKRLLGICNSFVSDPLGTASAAFMSEEEVYRLIARAESAESALAAARRESAEAFFRWVNDEARRKEQGFYMADGVLDEFRAALRGEEEG